MERDFRKLTKWIEETLETGIADEQRLFEWKLAEQAKVPVEKSLPVEQAHLS